MAFTELINIPAQTRNPNTFNSPQFNIPAVVDNFQFTFTLAYPGGVDAIASGNLRITFSLDGGTTWLPAQVFVWETQDQIGTVDKHGVTVTENPPISFIISVPGDVKNTKGRASVTLTSRQNIGLTISYE